MSTAEVNTGKQGAHNTKGSVQPTLTQRAAAAAQCGFSETHHSPATYSSLAGGGLQCQQTQTAVDGALSQGRSL